MRCRFMGLMTVALVALVLGPTFDKASSTTLPSNLAVSPAGNDDGPCTSNRPCKSIARAITVAKPGQTVVLAGGTYPGTTITRYSGRSEPVVVEPVKGAVPLFEGRITFRNASNIVLRGVEVSRAVPDAGIWIDTCNTAIRIENVTAKALAILQGNRAITFKGGSFGGYNTPSVEEDSAIGSFGTVTCADGKPAGPSTGIVLDGVRFHDSYWPARSRADFGTAHPDCFQIIGNVIGLTIRNSLFERCGDSFIGAYPDQGDFRNVVIANNTFRDLGSFTYFGMQISGQGHPFACSNITLRGNIYWPNNPVGTNPYSPIRTTCPATLVTGNLFQAGFSSEVCRGLLDPANGTSYSDNAFLTGPSCSTTRAIPWGYRVRDARLTPVPEQATAIRKAFALARTGQTPAEVAKKLRQAKEAAPGKSGWSAARVKALLVNRAYVGGLYGHPGSHPGIVKRAAWNAAQRSLAR